MTYQQGLYGTYPGKRTDFSLINQESELQPLDNNNYHRSILRNKTDTPTRDFYDIYDPYGTSTITKVPASQFSSYSVIFKLLN